MPEKIILTQQIYTCPKSTIETEIVLNLLGHQGMILHRN